MAWNFSFVIPGKLAGVAGPGTRGELLKDLEYLKSQGIFALVSLTPNVPDEESVKTAGLEHLHLPILDFTAPTTKQVHEFIDFTSKLIDDKKAVAVHCAAGYGRTGTMLACYLVYVGQTAQQAIESIRGMRPGSIETEEQVLCIHSYARELAQDSEK